MTTNQLPIRQCRYCGSEDLGMGWQHGEGIVTFKKYGILGNRMRCLICRRCGAVPMGGGTPQVPAHPVGHASPAMQVKDKNTWR